VLFASCAFGQSRIATIDLGKLFAGYWKTKQAEANLKERAADMEKEDKNMIADYNRAKEDYQTLLSKANELALSDEEKDKRKRQAEEKLKYIKETENTIAQYERQARVTIEESRKRLREDIMGDIRKVVTGKAKSAGYSLVIDTTAESINGTPVVLYSSGTESDLTQDVLTQLNASAPLETPKVDDTKPPEKKDDRKGEKKKG